MCVVYMHVSTIINLYPPMSVLYVPDHSLFEHGAVSLVRVPQIFIVNQLKSFCELGNTVNLSSESSNFASTLAIKMYLGEHDAYSILNTSQAH